MKYSVQVEFVPETAFEDIEWGWEAKVMEYKENGYEDEDTLREIESKFSYATLDEARADFDATLTSYLEALSREDRFERRDVEI